MQVEQAACGPRIVLYPVEGAGQLEDLALRQFLAVEGFLTVGEAALTAGRLVRHVVEKERHRHVEHARQIEQARGADAVRAVLVFLDLLEGQADRRGQLGLAEAQQGPPQPDAAADMNVDRAGLIVPGASRAYFGASRGGQALLRSNTKAPVPKLARRASYLRARLI